MDSSQTWGRHITFEVDKTVSAMYPPPLRPTTNLRSISPCGRDIVLASYTPFPWLPHKMTANILDGEDYLSSISIIHMILPAISATPQVGTLPTFNGPPGPPKAFGSSQP